MIYKGWNPPFIGGQQNILSQQSGDRIIKNDLLQLLMTSPGERMMRPTWGTGIKQYLFENIDQQGISGLISNIQSAISQYEPRVQAAVNITTDEEKHMVNITVSGTFTDQPNQTFEIELNLPMQQATEA